MVTAGIRIAKDLSWSLTSENSGLSTFAANAKRKTAWCSGRINLPRIQGSELVGDNISYIVHNLTNRTIILSDLRAEIGPHKMLDLEKIAERTAVDRSYDLRLALSTKRLRLISQGVVSKTSKPEVLVVEKVIEKHHHHETGQQSLDEVRLAALMKKIMLENQVAPQLAPADSSKQILEAMSALQSKIDAMGGDDSSNADMPSIDPKKLAELQAKAIDKISQDIETGIKKPGKKVILKNTHMGDLASELD